MNGNHFHVWQLLKVHLSLGFVHDFLGAPKSPIILKFFDQKSWASEQMYSNFTEMSTLP